MHISLNFLSSKPAQTAEVFLKKPVMEVVVFNSHANTSNMHGAR